MKKLVCLLSTVGLFTLGSFAVPVWGADLASKDKDFVKEAANGGMMEVALGEMAQTMAQSDDVKKFGSLMVTDHGKANEELKKVAQQKKVSLPTKLDRKAKSTEKKLKKHSGADFDKAYMQEMVKDHAKDVAEFRYAEKNVQDPDLNAWVKSTLPTLEQHLQMAKTTAQKLGIDVTKLEQEGTKEGEKKHK